MSAVTRSLVLLLGSLTAFSPLTIDMYLPTLPTLAETFGATMAEVQLTLSFYLTGLAIGQLLYGPLSDSYGRKPPLYVGLAIYIVTSIGCAFAPSIVAMIGLRFLQALGGCAGMIIARAIVRDYVSGQEAARVFSTLMLVMGVAPVLAPVGGSYLLVWFGWRAIFLLLAAFGALCLVIAILRLPETLPPERRRPSGLLHAVTAYRQLLRNRRFMGYVLGYGFAFASLFIYITGSPHLFIDIFQLSPTAYAWVFGSNAVGVIAMAQLNRLLLHRWSLYRVLSVALIVHLAFGVILVAIASTGASVWFIWPALFCTIASLGAISPNGVAAALSEEPGLAGSASSLAGTLPYVAGAAGGGLLGLLPATSGASMCGVIALFALIAFASHRLLVGRHVKDA